MEKEKTDYKDVFGNSGKKEKSWTFLAHLNDWNRIFFKTNQDHQPRDQKFCLSYIDWFVFIKILLCYEKTSRGSLLETFSPFLQEVEKEKIVILHFFNFSFLFHEFQTERERTRNCRYSCGCNCKLCSALRRTCCCWWCWTSPSSSWGLSSRVLRWGSPVLSPSRLYSPKLRKATAASGTLTSFSGQGTPTWPSRNVVISAF